MTNEERKSLKGWPTHRQVDWPLWLCSRMIDKEDVLADRMLELDGLIEDAAMYARRGQHDLARDKREAALYVAKFIDTINREIEPESPLGVGVSIPPRPVLDR